MYECLPSEPLMFFLTNLFICLHSASVSATSWGQGNCQWSNQFDCQMDNLSDNGCIDKHNQVCNGYNDCSWSIPNHNSIDEDPYWCGVKNGTIDPNAPAPAPEPAPAPAPAVGSWGQGNCQWSNQFDCQMDSLSDNGCIDKHLSLIHI